MRKTSEKARAAADKTKAAAPQPRVPQRRRGRERVAGLMASAAAVFTEKGFEAATMTEIAARAGGSIGSLYLFFPTKDALAKALLTSLADTLSGRLEALRARCAGLAPAAIAHALFDELASFIGEHPVYAALLDLPGDQTWRRGVRKRRRSEIAALFGEAEPALPPEQAERLAVIVPQLMRIPLELQGERRLSQGVLDELRLMLERHLEAAAGLVRA